MKKDELLKYICEIQPTADIKQLKKCKKAELDELYTRLKSDVKSSSPKQTKRKHTELIDFSISDDEEDLTDELPEESSVLSRQDADIFNNTITDKNRFVKTPTTSPVVSPVVSPKVNKNIIKKELKHITDEFNVDIKKLVNDFKEHQDKDLLVDRYNILLRDIEEIILEYLENVNADDLLFQYATAILDTSTKFIQRLTK
jgi:hypothetical protein